MSASIAYRMHVVSIHNSFGLRSSSMLCIHAVVMVSIMLHLLAKTQVAHLLEPLSLKLDVNQEAAVPAYCVSCQV